LQQSGIGVGNIGTWASSGWRKDSVWLSAQFRSYCHSRLRFGLDLLTTLNTRLATTLNYSSIADFHTLQITTDHSESFPACCVFTTRSQVTASNSGDSSTAPTCCLAANVVSWFVLKSLPSNGCIPYSINNTPYILIYCLLHGIVKVFS
jgi:hypothetical protein